MSLVFVGGKMVLSDVVGKVPVGISLGFVVGVLAVSVVLSLMFPPKKPAHELPTDTEPQAV